MADISDVMNTLVGQITGILYPSGTSAPSIAGITINVFPGWPIQDTLKQALKSGQAQVSVYPRPEERNVTRYPREWQCVTTNAPTLTLTISGQTVTVGGVIPPLGNPHNAAILVNGRPYIYAVQTTDTLTSIAAALASLIASGWTADSELVTADSSDTADGGVSVAGTTSTGPVITFPATARINAARIGVTATSAREIRRQERVFQIGIWADSPDHRDAIAAPIDVALAALTFLTMPDGFSARIIYKGSPMTDALEKTGLYRRDLYYTVEYATTQTRVDAQIVATELIVDALVGSTSEPIATVYD